MSNMPPSSGRLRSASGGARGNEAEPEVRDEVDPRDAIFDPIGPAKRVGGRLRGGALIGIAASGTKTALHLLSIAVLARLIPPEEFGVVAMTLPIVMVSMYLSHLGLPQAVVQRPKVSHRIVNTLFWFNLAAACSIGALLVLLSPVVGAVLQEPRVPPVLSALSVSLILSGLAAIHAGVLQRRMLFGRLALVTTSCECLGLAVAVAAALAGAGYWSIVAQQIVGSLALVILMTLFSGWRPSLPPLRLAQWREARALIAFGGQFAAVGLAIQTVNNAGAMVAARAFDAAASGLFFRAFNLTSFPVQRISGAIGGVALSGLSRVQGDRNRLEDMIDGLQRRLQLLLLPVAVLLAVASDLVVAILLGEDWQAVAPLLAWLSLVPLQSGLLMSLNWGLVAAGRTREFRRYGVASASVILLAFLGGSLVSVEAMAAAYAVSTTLVRIPWLLLACHRAGVVAANRALRTFLGDTLFAVALAAGIYALRPALSGVPLIVEAASIAALIGLGFVLFAVADHRIREDLAHFAQKLRALITRDPTLA